MFMIDYEHQLQDHGKLIVLVRNFDPPCPTSLFDQAFAAISEHHNVISPKLFGSRPLYRRFPRTQNGSFVGIPSDTQSALDDDSPNRDRPLWMRYIRDYSSFCHSWSSFQSHRAVLGLIGLCCCSTIEHVITAIQGYLRQKALISEKSINGRMFVLLSNPAESNDAALVSVAQVNELVQSLLLSDEEVIAHPIDQFFNVDLMFMHESPNTTTSVIRLITSSNTQTRSHSRTQLPMLNPRIARGLVSLVSQIAFTLEKHLSTVDPKIARIHTPSIGATGAEASDGDGSESSCSAMTSPVDLNSIKSPEDSVLDDSKFTTKPYVNLLTPDSPVTSPIQMSDDSNFSLFSGIKQRRHSGRWKKRLADIALQLGELELAQLYYSTSLQLLRPLMDNLWVAGAIEGLCAIAVIRRSTNSDVSDLPPRSKHLYAALSERVLSKSTDFIDMSLNKLKDSAIISPAEYCANALEALDLYRKANIDERMLEETSFKFARLLVTEKQTTKAIELLDMLFASSFDAKPDTTLPRTQRLNTLIKLYCELGYRRRACLVAWQSLDQSLRLPTEVELEALFTGLRIRAISAAMWKDYDPFCAENSVRTSSELSVTSSGLGKRTSSFILRRPAIPTSLSPIQSHHKSAWFRGCSGLLRDRTKPSHGTGVYRPRRHRMYKQTHSLDHYTFHATGWPELQAALLWHLIDVYKKLVSLDDAVEISWEKALNLIGFLFSLIDGWPGELTKSMCTTVMEDLCRLAILRCPDQPQIAFSGIRVNDVSGNVEHHRVTASVTGLLNGPTTKSNTLRQLVDLVEVPVHNLPAVRTINLLTLPDFLVPQKLSKEGHLSAVPVANVPHSNVTSNPTSKAAMNPSTGLFFYEPTVWDSASHTIVVDWVCEESVDLELMVDNALPVDLRISDIHIELVQVFATSSEDSSIPVTSSKETDLNSSWTPHSFPSVVQLEVVRLVMEKPNPSSRQSISRSSASPETCYSLELNQACLLEVAQDKRLHPQMDLHSGWRRPASMLSCNLPANTCGLRLFITVIPTMRLFSPPDWSSDEEPMMYRVVGLTYRLVDFGAMHVSVREPLSFPNPDPNSGRDCILSSTPVRERRPSNSSSSANSALSVLRSSCNSASEFLSTPCVPGTECVLEHPTVSIVSSLFRTLPSVRVHLPMPRLYMFPGIVRSAYTFKEAREFLPTLTTPSVGTTAPRASADVRNHHIQPSRFRTAIAGRWSPNVAAVMDISLYPYESRWLPLQLLVRDGAHLATASKSSDSPRQLNVFHVTVRAIGDSAVLLKKLNLHPDTLIQCDNLDTIKQKLPLSIRNEEVRMPSSNRTSIASMRDAIERVIVQPQRATECGLLWLHLCSETYWQVCAHSGNSASDQPDSGLEANLRTSCRLQIEVHIEYAVYDPTSDTPTSSVSASFVRPCIASVIGNPARQVALGFQLHLLSSKHAPLTLYYPQLMFRDAPFDDESKEDVTRAEDVVPGDVESKSFFYYTLRARLPASLVPRPIRFTHHQYRVALQVTSAWDAPHSNRHNSVTLHTHWSTISDFLPETPVPSSETGVNGLTSSPIHNDLPSYRLVEYPDAHSKSESDVLYQHITLPLDRVSDVLFRGAQPISLIHPNDLSSNEIRIPIPADTQTLVNRLESSIKIMWQSRLYGRPFTSIEVKSNSDVPREGTHSALPNSQFYRYGRFLLGAHYAELSATEPQDNSETPTGRTNTQISKRWYGLALSTAASIIGLLWCHNIRLDITLTNVNSTVNASDNTESGICRACREGPTNKALSSLVSRRMSSPLEMLASVYRPMKLNLSRLGERIEEDDEGEEEEQKPSFPRTPRLSVPDLQTPRQLQDLDSDLLCSVFRVCVQPYQPLAIVVHGSVLEHPLDGVCVASRNRTQSDGEASSLLVRLLRVWTGPVVYEIRQDKPKEPKPKTDPTLRLSPPLTEGKDFACIGNMSGVIGLTLRSESPCWLKQTSSIVFFRPGRYWICGLMGLIPSDLSLPSVHSSDFTNITLPCSQNVETIRFSPSGIAVHVYD